MNGSVVSLHNLGGVPWQETQSLYHTQAEMGLPSLNIVWPLEPYVCAGRFQDLEAEVDLEECRRRGLPVIRREVGGGAVYLDGRQVFYQLVVPLSWLGSSYDYRWLFRMGLDAVVLALKRLGVNAAVRGANDVVVGKRKISGNGAGEIGRAAVVVGNILMDFDYEAMAAVLRVPDEKFRDKAYRSMKDNLTTLADIEPAIGSEQVAAVLAHAFCETLPSWMSLRTAVALPPGLAERLPATTARLTSEEWLHRVRRRREQQLLRIRQGLELRRNVWKAPGGLLHCRCAIEDGTVAWVALSGDFFIHPADALEQLEDALLGLATAEVREAAARFLARAGVTMPGVGPEDIERSVLGQGVDG